MLRTTRSRSPLSRRALPAGVDYRLRTALRSLLAFGPTPVEMYANTSNAGLRRRIRTAPAIPFVSLDTPTDAPPAPKWTSFTGGDGQFNGLISRPQILLPLRVLDSIIYQIDLASDSLFTTNLETVSEGQTRAFNKGGFSTVNRYARVRAKFPTSDWTGWIAFGLPTAVASGTVPTDLGDLTGDLDDVADSGTRFAAEEANANRTETHTSADTTLVSGTAAATVETGAVRANAGLNSAGDLARDVITNRVVESSLLTGIVAVAKLKTETVNRIWQSQTMRDAAVDSSGNLLLKNVGKVQGSTSGPTTASTTFIDLTDITKTITTKGNVVYATFSGQFRRTSGADEFVPADLEVRILRDSTAVGKVQAATLWKRNTPVALTITVLDDGASAASHTYKVQWRSRNGFTLRANTTDREMQVVELG